MMESGLFTKTMDMFDHCGDAAELSTRSFKHPVHSRKVEISFWWSSTRIPRYLLPQSSNNDGRALLLGSGRVTQKTGKEIAITDESELGHIAL